jgi:hypothetical protein
MEEATAQYSTVQVQYVPCVDVCVCVRECALVEYSFRATAPGVQG